jgi:hypothetical protein
LIIVLNENIPEFENEKLKITIISGDDEEQFNEFISSSEFFLCEIEMFQHFLMPKSRGVEEMIADALEYRTEKVANIF